ncbi:MAG: hypothetical protein EXS35_05350 [Pedosphaera sp.]|nr:hypothetical protein [Pedosphaera sp.]
MSHTQTTLTDEEYASLEQWAARLRLIQTDAATLSAEKRREYLGEEMERNLKNTPPANRKRYLQAMLQRFPVAGQVATSASAPIPVLAPAAAPAPSSPRDLLDRFLEAAAQLPEETRNEFSKRLYDAGLVWVDRDSLVIDVSDELRKTLGITPTDQVRLSRVVEMAIVLADIFARLDQTAMTAMRDLSPKSSLLRRSQDFRAAAARFLVTDSDPLEPQVKAIAGLLGGLIAAILGGGRDFGRDLVERLSPGAIEMVVTDEGKSGKFFGKNKKELCWEKYLELAEDFATADHVDRKIKDCLGAFVEKRVMSSR